MKKFEIFFILLILLAAFAVRLYKFDSPLADWHSWRQADTSSVSRQFVEKGYDLLHPTYHDLSNVPSGYDNPQGYRFVEFPIYNLLQAGFYEIFGIFTLEQWGRLVTISSSILTTLFIYLIVRRYADSYAALFSAFFYALLPFSIYFGRVILPESAMTAAILGGIYFFDLFISSNQKNNSLNTNFGISILFTAIAFLLKPYALFFTLPMVYLAWSKFKLHLFVKRHLWFFLLFTLTPLVLWRWWMSQYPEGIPYNTWLFNAGEIRFKGAFFYWLFADRIGRMILGYWGLILLGIGVLINSGRDHLKNNGIFFYTFLISSLLYLTIMARGNVQHDYYQILIIPSIAIFMGLGARVLYFPPAEFIHKAFSRIFLLLIILFSLSFSWYHLRDFYNINNPAIITAGKAADQLLPKDAKVIAPLEGDTTLLYHTKRSGWASFQNPILELIGKGATHLLVVNPQKHDYAIGNEYKIIAASKEYLIFDLKKPAH